MPQYVDGQIIKWNNTEGLVIRTSYSNVLGLHKTVAVIVDFDYFVKMFIGKRTKELVLVQN
jgi:hypothetical protein